MLAVAYGSTPQLLYTICPDTGLSGPEILHTLQVTSQRIIYPG